MSDSISNWDETVFFLRSRLAHKGIATALGCSTDDVSSVFDWLPSPYATNPTAAKVTKNQCEDLLEISALVKHLVQKLEKLEGKTLDRCLQDSGVSISELTELHRRTFRSGSTSPDAPIMRSYKGGKNWAAYDIAEGISQVFLRLDRSITFGHEDGEPTTDFGRAVKLSIEAFSVQANWREPARYAAANTEF